MRVPARVTCWVCAGVLAATAALSFSTEPDRTSRKDLPALATLVLLAPGTQITGPQKPPAGWTHLVIKSVPRLTSGDLSTLPALAHRTATLFRTALLAEVRPSAGAGSPFVLRRVGVGLCTPLNDVDTVVSSTTVDTLHVPFGLVERTVLQKAEEDVARGRVKARTPTFALYCSPAVQKVEKEHEAVLLCYAFLVDSKTGALQTLLWSLAADARERTPREQLVLLPPGLVNDTMVDVLAERVLGAIPVNWSFAMAALPSGKALRTTPAVREWTLRDLFTPAEAIRLETDLRAMLEKAER